MQKLLWIAGAALTLVSNSVPAAEVVDRQTVLELRQMAIDAGQTSSSTAQKPPKNPEAIEAERKSIESHRAAFFERVKARGVKVPE